MNQLPHASMQASALREVLDDESRTAFGMFVMLESSVSSAVIARSGYDFLVVDLQHAPFDLRRFEMTIAATHGTPCTPLARVLPGRPDQIEWALDQGAHGVVVPLVNTVADAERAVAACRYPPRGTRSMGSFRNVLYRGDDYGTRSDDDVMCVIQIEHHSALDQIDEILDVPGIDAVMPGHVDLAISMGHRLSYGPSVSNTVPAPVAEAIALVERAAADRGIPVIPVTGSAAEVETALRQGHRVVCCNTDYHTFKHAAETQIAACRRFLSDDSN